MKHTLAAILATTILAALALPALAVHGPPIIVGNQVIMRLRYPAGGMSVQQRADMVTTRINALLGCPRVNLSAIRAERRGGSYAVVYGNDLIATVDRNTAIANGTNPRMLAEQWARHLRQVVPMAKGSTCGTIPQ